MSKEGEVAVRLARQAGEVLRRGWGRRDLHIEQKGQINPVTEIDHESEALITGGLSEAFPDYGILAEEGTSKSAKQKARWIIDPLDGTVNFIRGIPLTAVSIGLEKDGELVLGVVYNPFTDELFVGEQGQGATLNGNPIHVTSVETLGQAVISSGFPYDAWTNQDNNTREWAFLVKSAMTVRCDGSAALDLCQVACGRFDGYVEKGISPWDIAAGIVIVREAAGMVTDYRGGPEFLAKGEVIAANPVLSRELMTSLAKCQPGTV
jgi:myo-inositol-1(or 4)-monophosphatase